MIAGEPMNLELIATMLENMSRANRTIANMNYQLVGYYYSMARDISTLHASIAIQHEVIASICDTVKTEIER